MAKLKSGEVRWLEGPGSSMLHAYSWTWDGPADMDPARCLPVCGRAILRTSRGRGSTPGTGAEVCEVCAGVVGFRRRPRTSATWARRYGNVRPRGLSVEARVAVLEAELADLVTALRASGTLAPADDGPRPRPGRRVKAAEP